MLHRNQPQFPMAAGIDRHDAGALAEDVMFAMPDRVGASPAVPSSHIRPDGAKVLALWLVRFDIGHRVRIGRR